MIEPQPYGPGRHDESVYVARGAGRVLYVGISSQIARRLLTHAKAGSWWHLATEIELHHVDSRGEALALEQQLIRDLQPEYNRAGRSWSETVAAYARAEAETEALAVLEREGEVLSEVLSRQYEGGTAPRLGPNQRRFGLDLLARDWQA